MVDIKYPTAEIRRGNKKRKKKKKKKNKPQHENIMVCPIHRATINIYGLPYYIGRPEITRAQQ